MAPLVEPCRICGTIQFFVFVEQHQSGGNVNDNDTPLFDSELCIMAKQSVGGEVVCSLLLTAVCCIYTCRFRSVFLF